MNILAAIVLSISSFNAAGPEYVPIDYAPPLSVLGGEFRVQPAPPDATSVLVEARVEAMGYAFIENLSAGDWDSPHAWAPFSAGRMAGFRHLTGGYFGGAAYSQTWPTNKSEMMGTHYNAIPVGWPEAFDGVIDGLGPSGRSWQLRGISLLTATDSASQWQSVSVDGMHHFKLDTRGTGGFLGATPPGATARAQGMLKVHWIRVTYL